MSVSQPFNNFRQADDFFNVYLNSQDSINSSNQNPRWRINASGAVCDRYKSFKKCIAVVNWVDLPSHANVDNNGIIVRDIMNQQMNSSDSNINQTNIIYHLDRSRNNPAAVPFEKANPFGEQEFILTLAKNSTAINPGNEWGIHITYYFYYNN